MNKKTIIVILALAAAVAVLAISGAFTSTGNTVKTAENSSVKEFRIDAFRFGYSLDKITVNKGDRVRIVIVNTDVPHGMKIPDFKIEGQNEIEFTADKAGEFAWYCATPCGSKEGHLSMKGELIVK